MMFSISRRAGAANLQMLLMAPTARGALVALRAKLEKQLLYFRGEGNIHLTLDISAWEEGSDSIMIAYCVSRFVIKIAS
jgi:hypothetical protein